MDIKVYHSKLTNLKPIPSSLSEKDTVCSFCGVSYLILHEIEKFKTEISELKKQLSIMSRKNQASQLQDRQATDQVSAVADMNAALNHQLAEYRVDNIELKATISAKDERITSLFDRLNSAEIVATKLQEELHSTKVSLNMQKVTLSQKPRIDELQQAIQKFCKMQLNISKELESQITQKKAENELLSFKYDEQKKLVTKQQENMGIMSQQHRTELEEQSYKYQAAINDLNVEFEKQKSLYRKLQLDFEQQQIYLTDLQHDIDQKNKMIEIKLQQAENYQKEIKSQQNDLKQNEELISKLKTETREQQLLLEQQDKRYESIKLILEEKQVDYQNIYNELSALKKSSQQQIQNYEQQQVDFICKIRTLETENMQLREINSNSSNQLKLIQQSEQLLQEHMKKNLMLEQRIKELEKVINQLNEQLQSIDLASQDIKSKNEKLQAQLISEKQTSEVLKQANDAMQDNEKKLLDRILRLEADLRQQTQKSDNSLRLAQLEQENRTSKEKLDQLLKEYDTIKKSKIDDDKKISQMEQQLVKYDQQIYEQKNLIERLKNEQVPLRQENESLKEQIKKLQATVLNECKERNYLMRELNTLRSKK